MKPYYKLWGGLWTPFDLAKLAFLYLMLFASIAGACTAIYDHANKSPTDQYKDESGRVKAACAVVLISSDIFDDNDTIVQGCRYIIGGMEK